MSKIIGFDVSCKQGHRTIDLFVSDPKGMSAEYVQSRIATMQRAFPSLPLKKATTTV